ncbi:phosphohistidine phosphatase SixA [Psychrobacter sp. N25K4-3-2]|jgi:phosphohistidine phosphatase|uniref:phosphohistidine phosphatase SixA n=1 Tax=unclassified Psychrobacter TaxID=196806 RepID=UPI00188C2756|nr:phosphohistidine phosphatase SixA [Psychrobacter sp. N25K4-3-2]MBF4488510.1 phosphohistidine phosphatase SixA [Psychrobacter sp. N25K4-3-2]
MKIILVRHGQAEDETRPDSARQLTKFGQQQAAQTAEYITTNYRPDRFIVSPYDRAQQTLAELQAHAPTIPATVQDNITPSDDAHSALTDIAKIEAQCLVVVCHMSIVANLAGLLTGDYPESFSLAEARVFEMDFIMSGMATEVDRFVPEQPY